MDVQTVSDVQLQVDLPIAEPYIPARLLTVAGSDSGGGAGIQADLKTFAALNCFGMSALTAITAQNTEGVQGVHMLSSEFVGQQIDSVLADLGVDVVKTGMLGTKEIVQVTAAKLKQYGVQHVVVDPVMISTSGHALLEADAVETYKSELLPLATLITPNIKEAEHLLGFKVINVEDMKRAAVELHKLGPKAVLVKGGDKHGEQDDVSSSTDVLFDGRCCHVVRAVRVAETRNVHGTGCTLASAIAAFFATDTKKDIYDAVCKAKIFLTQLLHKSKGVSLGNGAQGPMHHALM